MKGPRAIRKRRAAFVALLALVAAALLVHRLGLRALRVAPERPVATAPRAHDPGSRVEPPSIAFARMPIALADRDGRVGAGEGASADDPVPGALVFEVHVPGAAAERRLEFVLVTAGGEGVGTRILDAASSRVRFDALAAGEPYSARIQGFRWLGAPLELGPWRADRDGDEHVVTIELESDILVTEFRWDETFEDFEVFEDIPPGLFFAGTPDHPGTMRTRWKVALAHTRSEHSVRLDAPGRESLVVPIDHPVTTFRLGIAGSFEVRLLGLEGVRDDVHWILFAHAPGYPEGEEYGSGGRANESTTARFPAVVDGDWRFELHVFQKVEGEEVSLPASGDHEVVLRVVGHRALELPVPEELVRRFR